MELLTLAQIVAIRIRAQATRAGVPVAVSVIDNEGHMVLQHRMDGAPLHAIAVSERKAYTSALVGKRTADLGQATEPGEPLYAPVAVGGGRYCVLAGGVPLRDGDTVVGGVGVSGGTAAEDVAFVEAALGGLIQGHDPVRSPRLYDDRREIPAPRRSIDAPAHP
jgi:uncharacterized protein GlcG (DUF336 family)